jgi:RNA polymerase sigma factor (sigma-70 family)
VKYLSIISAFQEDLKKGLATLFESYGQNLYGFTINHWHLNEDESYDVLYKTLEIVGKVITRYEFSSENHFVNWLFKIHKNNILQLLRSKRSKEKLELPVNFQNWENEVKELENEDLNLQDFKSTIDSLSIINPYENTPTTNHLMVAMQKALQQLDETDRELLLLRMSNYSYEEIAGMLGIENNQLKVKFNRAKAKVEKKTLAILKDTYNETAK